ncbi:MAG: hypothetical protein GYB66_09850 [Chloroflexi bacterium]|nr:hypothetical protein [Chloroflexota bacterium]
MADNDHLLTSYFSFTPADLDANRSGMLSPAQSQVLNARISEMQQQDKQTRRTAIACAPLMFLIFTAVFAGRLFFADVAFDESLLVLGIPLGILIFVLVVSLLSIGRATKRERAGFLAGQVHHVEGSVSIRALGGDADGNPLFALQIGGKTYVEALNRQHFDEGAFHALSEGSVARAYYFGNRLLSIELIESQNMLYPSQQTDSPPLGQAFVFDATDLAANRMGNLSEAQRQRFSAEMRSPDRACLLIVLLLAAVPASIPVVALLTNETESLQSEAEANPVLPVMLIGFSIVVAALA